MRRHNADYELGIAQRFFQIVGGGDAEWNWQIRQKEMIYATLRDGLANVFFISPERYVVCALASENDGERGSPGASADDSDLAHALAPFLLPKRLSVPARRRRMFWWCLAMMRAAAPRVVITNAGVMLPR